MRELDVRQGSPSLSLTYCQSSEGAPTQTSPLALRARTELLVAAILMMRRCSSLFCSENSSYPISFSACVNFSSMAMSS